MDSHHPSAHAGAEKIHSVRSEPAPQNPVKCCRHSAPYDVAEHCSAGLKAGVGLNLAGKLSNIRNVLAERDDG